MKNYFKLSIAFALLSVSVLAQQEVNLKISYTPETEYRMTTEQEVQSTIAYLGSKKKLEEIKKNGLENPVVRTQKSTAESICNTGKLEGNTMQMTIEYLAEEGEQSAIPAGTIVYGKVTADELPVFDSIYSPGMDEQLKAMVLNVASSTLSQLQIPETKLKVGESFDHSSPVAIPLGATTMEMDIVSTYKLVSVDKGIAIFDITQVYNMKTTIADMDVKAKGKGKGKMTYDIASKYFTDLVLNNEMTMKMKLDNEVSMDIQMLQKIVQTTKISKK